MLEPLWYNDLLLSPLVIEIFLSGFIHYTQYFELGSDHEISLYGSPELYDFYRFVLNEAVKRVDLIFSRINMDMRKVELR